LPIDDCGLSVDFLVAPIHNPANNNPQSDDPQSDDPQSATSAIINPQCMSGY